MEMRGNGHRTLTSFANNSCILPEGWTVDTLMEPHESELYNPDIAGVFYRAGFIETWGRAFKRFAMSAGIWEQISRLMS